jgi:DegV family protein with EDD domain
VQRPSVLLIEPDADLRKQISTGLARFGYEVVPAVDAAEGVRFAAGLDLMVLVADADVPGFADNAVRDRLPELDRGDGGALVLLGRRPVEEAELPRAVRYLVVDGLSTEEMVRRLRLVLLGREIGVETDPALEALVGDLAQTPPLELVRALHRARFTGQVDLPGGEVRLDRGEVAAATARPVGAAYRPVGGVKAFCRLGRLRQGTFHVRPLEALPAPAPAEAIGAKLDDLVIRAVEDASAGELPHPRSRLKVELGPAFFATTFTPAQQRALESAQRGATLGTILDEQAATDGAVLAELHRLRDSGLLTLEEPEARLYVVTDSSADLPETVVRSHGIQVVPMAVSFGDERFHDGVDLTPRQFYEMLEQRSDHPVTAPPQVTDFLGRYRELLARRDVVSVHISERMSQTVVHARQAAQDALAATPRRRAGEPPAEAGVIDTGVVSLGLGLLAVAAARMAARDLGTAEVVRRLEEMRQRVGILFVVDTLEYLRRGGRIGAARAWMGKLLGIKPILGVEGGEVVPVDRVRGGRAAHPRILELMAGRADASRPLIAGIAHARAPVWADRLRKLVEERFDVVELTVSEMGPTVGTHAGPGTVGVAWLQPTDEELELVAPLEGGSGDA